MNNDHYPSQMMLFVEVHRAISPCSAEIQISWYSKHDQRASIQVLQLTLTLPALQPF